MEIVKYHNNINKLKLGHFTENETDIFFSLLMKARDAKENLIVLDFLELKKLSHGDKNNDRFVRNILGLNLKLKSMSQTIEIEKGVFLTFSLFGDILTDTNKKIIEIPINPRFKGLIKDLIGNFTIFDLKELVSLKGNYSKVLFRLLKQWETTKEFIISMEEFRDTMGIPNTYEQRNINQKVLEPCLEQLKQHFNSLKVEKVKKGVKIDKLIFTWKAKVKPVKNLGSAVKIKQGLTDEEFEKYISKGTKKSKKIENPEEIQKQEKRKLTQEEYEEKYLEFLNGRKATAKEKKLFDAFMKIRFEMGE